MECLCLLFWCHMNRFVTLCLGLSLFFMSAQQAFSGEFRYIFSEKESSFLKNFVVLNSFGLFMGKHHVFPKEISYYLPRSINKDFKINIKDAVAKYNDRAFMVRGPVFISNLNDQSAILVLGDADHSEGVVAFFRSRSQAEYFSGLQKGQNQTIMCLSSVYTKTNMPILSNCLSAKEYALLSGTAIVSSIINGVDDEEIKQINDPESMSSLIGYGLYFMNHWDGYAKCSSDWQSNSCVSEMDKFSVFAENKKLHLSVTNKKIDVQLM